MNKWYFSLRHLCFLAVFICGYAHAAATMSCHSTLFDFFPNHKNVVETSRLIVRHSGVGRLYSVYEKGSGILVGTYLPDGILFETAFAGRGYATEAMLDIIPLELQQERAGVLEVHTITDESRALFKKLGFVIKNARYSQDTMVMTRSDYERRLRNIDQQFDGNRLAFAKPSLPRYDSSRIEAQVLAAVAGKKIDLVRSLLEKLLENYKTESIWLLSRQIFLEENRFLLADFMSRFPEHFSSEPMRLLQIELIDSNLRNFYLQKMAINTLARSTPEVQSGLLNVLQKKLKNDQVDHNRKLYYKFVQLAQQHGIWMQEEVPAMYKNANP